jgi:hypothetical protein
MKRNIEQEEMIQAMADSWLENYKIEIYESQAEQLMRENNMPRLTNDQRELGRWLINK